MIINARCVISRRHLGTGRSEDLASAQPVQISSQEPPTGVLLLNPQATQADPHVSGTVTTTQSTASTVSTASTHSQVSATVTSVTTSDVSNSEAVRVSFLFYSASGSFCSVACYFFA